MASSLGADLCMLLLHRERKTGEQSYRYHCVFSFFFLFWCIILWIISFFASVFSFAFIFLKKTFHMLHFICLSGTVCNDASNADGSTSSGPTDAYVPSWFGTANFLWLSTPIYSTSGIPVLLLSFTTVFVLINDTLFASS
jgi:hypothetical protein